MLKAANWSSYQSYKDRKPPWIRLHKSMLDNYEYQMMSAEARAMLPMLWLLASEDEDPTSGLVTDSLQKISFRLRIGIDVVTSAVHEIVDAGFFVEIQQCSESVTKPLQDCIDTVTPETETETETETKDILPENLKVPMHDGFEPNETNYAWVNDSALTLDEKQALLRDFIDYWKLDGSKKTPKGWQMAFRKNPVIKRKIVNSNFKGEKNGPHQQGNRSKAEQFTDKLRQIAEDEIREQGFTKNLD